MQWQWPAVAGRQFVEPLASTAAQRFVAGDALGKQQAFDPVDVLDPLGDQYFALAAEAAAIFFLRRRRFYHRTYPRFPALERKYRAKQRLAVDPVGLGAPTPPRRRNRGGNDDVAFDSFALQHAMNPEAIETGFLNNHYRKGFSGPRQRLLLQFRKTRQQCRNVPGRH